MPGGGTGGGARFFGGSSLFGVDAVDPDELFVLSFDICLGGGPVGLFKGSAGGSPLARLLLLDELLGGLAAWTKFPMESEIGMSGSTIGPAIENMSEKPAFSVSSSGCAT